ncbi:hypothetical protein BDW74DRAFT_178936 [Aspergillus multicolor]|uniref:uncharacterized protein n=1 Tax=Aspergillus multicolor TaxID=41759 RepID=UPI003CCE0B67
MTYNITEKETQPKTWCHLSGSPSSTDTVFPSSAKAGWYTAMPRNKQTIMMHLSKTAPWSSGLTIDDFISTSIEGRANGDFIMHRMKATISQRFNFDGVAFDVDYDCRFINFCMKTDGEWKVVYVKLLNEKDRLVPVDGQNVPSFGCDKLSQFPTGYQYLAVAQK